MVSQITKTDSKKANNWDLSTKPLYLKAKPDMKAQGMSIIIIFVMKNCLYAQLHILGLSWTGLSGLTDNVSDHFTNHLTLCFLSHLTTNNYDGQIEAELSFLLVI